MGEIKVGGAETLWSARVEAKTINDGFDDIVGLLEKMSEDPNEPPGTKGGAGQLLHILTFNFFALLSFWYDILAKINRVQKRLQYPSINLQEASRDIEAHQLNVSATRDDLCQRSVEKGKEQCTECGYKGPWRKVRSSARNGGGYKGPWRKVRSCALNGGYKGPWRKVRSSARNGGYKGPWRKVRSSARNGGYKGPWRKVRSSARNGGYKGPWRKVRSSARNGGYTSRDENDER